MLFFERLREYGFEAISYFPQNDIDRYNNRLHVYQLAKYGEESVYQVIVPCYSWTEAVCEDGAVDGLLFMQAVLGEFDLTICRNAIFDWTYIQRYF